MRAVGYSNAAIVEEQLGREIETGVERPLGHATTGAGAVREVREFGLARPDLAEDLRRDLELWPLAAFLARASKEPPRRGTLLAPRACCLVQRRAALATLAQPEGVTPVRSAAR